MDRLERKFDLSREALWGIIDRFHSEMDKGLAGSGSSLKMIPTYVTMPTGRERGSFLALDLGGTNFRVLEVSLKGHGITGRPGIMKFALAKKHMAGTSDDLFLFLADSVKAFLKKYRISGRARLSLGFTFSFPIKQTGIAGGTLMCWTKGFAAAGVVGNDVVKLLNDALLRKGVKNIRVSALVNDTVGTLAAKSYEDRNCDAGVIIGTGTNACYPEKMANIKKWRRSAGDPDRMIINIEWGNFNRIDLTDYDKELDSESGNPGEQILEKMVSGMYLGDIARRVLKDLAKSGTISRHAHAILSDKGVFCTEHMSVIEGDTTAGLKKTESMLKKIGLPAQSLRDMRIIRKACRVVSTRAARISASCIAAIVTKMDPDLTRKHTIAVDGSVFEKHPTFASDMEKALKTILGNKSGSIKLTLAKDGSGKGAAIIAAVAASV